MLFEPNESEIAGESVFFVLSHLPLIRTFEKTAIGVGSCGLSFDC